MFSFDLSNMDGNMALALGIAACITYFITLTVSRMGWQERVVRNANAYERLLAISGDNPTDREREVLERLRDRAYATAHAGMSTGDMVMTGTAIFSLYVLLLSMVVTVALVLLHFVNLTVLKPLIQVTYALVVASMVGAIVFVTAASISTLRSAFLGKRKNSALKNGHDSRKREADERKEDEKPNE